MKKKLREVAEIRSGFPFRTRIDNVPNGAVDVVQLRNIDEIMGINWSSAISDESRAEPTVRTNLTGRKAKAPDWLRPEDILFAARGDRNLAVYVAEVPSDAVCSPHFFQLRVTDESVLPQFLAWQINQLPAQSYLQTSSGGTLIRNIRRDILEALPITIPRLDRQRLIVALDGVVKRERRNLEQRINNGQQLLNAVALDLFNSQQ